MRVLGIGEVLWDVFPQRELLGGAPLNFCANMVRLGHQASLITAVANDKRGLAAQRAMTEFGLDTSLIQIVNEPATGVAIVRTTPEGDPSFEIPRPAAFDEVSPSPKLTQYATAMAPHWLYFGTLLQTNEHAEQLTRELAHGLAGVRCFYDMNLRPGCWNMALVERLCTLANVLKLNESEARTLSEQIGVDSKRFSAESFCAEWANSYDIESICITLGAAGCLVYMDGDVSVVSGFPAQVEDTVGAGDAFAAAFLHGYHLRWPALQTARFANAVGSVVASHAGATPSWRVEECCALASISVEEIYAAHT
jgi:fructokinase